MNEFDDLTDLDGLLGVLRSDAQRAELSQETEMVDRMVKAHRTPEEKHMFGSRPARIAALVAAGVLGFGGIAAAGSPSADEFLDAALEEVTEEVEESTEEVEEVEDAEDAEESTEEVEESTDESEETEDAEKTEESSDEAEETAEPEGLVEVTEDLVEQSGDEPLPDLDESTEFNESYCEPGNHGKTVSAVARGVFDPDDEYPGDVTVTMAAQSSCGKLDALPDEPTLEDPATEESEVEESEVEEPEVEESEVEAPDEKRERPGKSAEGQGNGNGNGKTNGNGNGNGKRGG